MEFKMTNQPKFSGLDQCRDTFDTLSFWADATPDNQAVSILNDGEEVSDSLTYAELESRALSCAHELAKRGLSQKAVLILVGTSIDFAILFYGCLASRSVAAPVGSPRSGRMKHWRSIELIIKSAGIYDLILDASQYEIFNELREQSSIFESCNVILVDELVNSKCANVVLESRRNEDVALLQFTSGSTGVPKGAMLTQENLIQFHKMFSKSMDLPSSGTWVSWLPLYHDMGLNSLVHAIFNGMHCLLMSPVSFIQKPIRWAQAMSRFQGNVSSAPNFAYNLLADALNKVSPDDYDLGCWERALCGAEPVRVETLDRFNREACKFGFNSLSFKPCYGLAEAVVGVSIVTPVEPYRSVCVDKVALENHVFKPVLTSNESNELNRTASNTSVELVSAGRVLDGLDVVIVDPNSVVACGEGEVGEIWVHGASVSTGYWKNKEATKVNFECELPGTSKRYFRTGDLGLVYQDHLYVTGRLKDMIIVNGRNIYPSDLEQTIQASHSALRDNSGVVFSIDDGENEKIIVVQEIERSQIRNINTEEVSKSIILCISEKYQVNIHEIILLKPAKLSKTTSGKVQRSLTKKSYLDGKLDVFVQRPEKVEPKSISLDIGLIEQKSDRHQSHRMQRKQLERIILSVLLESATSISEESISIKKSLFELGLSSIETIKFVGELSLKLNYRLEPELVWKYPSITELAKYILGQQMEVSEPTVTTVTKELLEDISEEEALALLYEEVS